jgi:hypothetical protein
MRAAHDSLKSDSSCFQDAPLCHVLTANAIAVRALPFKQQHLEAAASQDSSDRCTRNACPDDNDVGILRRHTHS